jgi:hypothetical protein
MRLFLALLPAAVVGFARVEDPEKHIYYENVECTSAGELFLNEFSDADCMQRKESRSLSHCSIMNNPTDEYDYSFWTCDPFTGAAAIYYNCSPDCSECEQMSSVEDFFEGLLLPYVDGCVMQDEHEDEENSCSEHGLSDDFSPEGCPLGCECCDSNGWCGECNGESACITGLCFSCHDLFGTDDGGVVEDCKKEVGEGWDFNGAYYDNTCPNPF